MTPLTLSAEQGKRKAYYLYRMIRVFDSIRYSYGSATCSNQQLRCQASGLRPEVPVLAKPGYPIAEIWNLTPRT
jgi:hypothetical protein